MNNMGGMLIKHGMTKTRFYNIWGGIKQRCYNKNHIHYKNYGGRGIKMCDRWFEDFMNFKEDMYASYIKHCKEYGESNTSIDRVDSDGIYSKDNCKWSTNKEQQNNLRNNIKIDVDGVEYSVFEASQKFNIPHQTIRGRFNEGSRGYDLVRPKSIPIANRRSGVKGVIWMERSEVWHVKGIKDGESDCYITSFEDLEDALNFKRDWDNGLISEVPKRKNNSSGIVGIRFTNSGKWEACINKNKKRYQKVFSDLSDAIAWRENKKEKVIDK